MFENIETEIVRRTADIRDYLNEISILIPAAPAVTPRHLSLARGFVDVHLYGMIEYTIRQVLASVVSLINSEGVKISAVKNQIIGMALNAEFDSLIQSNKTKWDNRYSLLSKIEQDAIVNIRDDIMPTNGQNFTRPQLESIWRIFCLKNNCFHDFRFLGLLSSIVGNRISVAHGNSSGVDTVGSISATDMYTRIGETFNFCIYFLESFRNYILNKDYLK